MESGRNLQAENNGKWEELTNTEQWKWEVLTSRDQWEVGGAYEHGAIGFERILRVWSNEKLEELTSTEQ